MFTVNETFEIVDCFFAQPKDWTLFDTYDVVSNSIALSWRWKHLDNWAKRNDSPYFIEKGKEQYGGEDRGETFLLIQGLYEEIYTWLENHKHLLFLCYCDKVLNKNKNSRQLKKQLKAIEKNIDNIDSIKELEDILNGI